jgi:hypothetical protein
MEGFPVANASIDKNCQNLHLEFQGISIILGEE